jgi:hypothetical protein
MVHWRCYVWQDAFISRNSRPRISSVIHTLYPLLPPICIDLVQVNIDRRRRESSYQQVDWFYDLIEGERNRGEYYSYSVFIMASVHSEAEAKCTEYLQTST